MSKVPLILPNVALLPTDKEVIFPYLGSTKTGLYKLNLDLGKVQLWLHPVQGLIYSPVYSSDGCSLLYVAVEKVEGKETCIIYLVDVNEKNRKKVLELQYNIIDAAFAPDGKRIYFTTAADIGNSSPLVRAHPRQMRIYSVNIHGLDMKLEMQKTTYSIGGKLSFAKDGNTLFFQMVDNVGVDSALKRMEESNISHTDCGPFMFNVKSKELKSLVPANYKDLYNEIDNNFLLDFLSPVAANHPNEILLLSATTIYKLNLTTMQGQFFYEQSEEDRVNKRYRVQQVIPFHQQNNT